MSGDNNIRFPGGTRARIEIELARACDTFGEDHIETLVIVHSWGDTLDDEQVLAALRKLNNTGSMFDDVTDRAD
ncbi:hypothetical protein SAMN04488498_1294 [Mesorhizobium albiziae]|uniref:Uncharacterized protein n=1 Tax=Neomesorhizobium albiziae TaxID=335020 RepID=A0A1I4ESA0_9HYPH|nr:hypothetical protein [Mesorhizobium albiziae]GLS30732.1 hypothetical protein GCM10007937_24400 [Mesorhizobium albiziae]SFL07417.1 hypothetical protein SAMN04488498_1294 [Mesorhizobium albiziae]